MLRLAFATGTEPGKWCARYRDLTGRNVHGMPCDDPFELIDSGAADLALMRIPDNRVGAPGETFHRVTLYSEKPGVAVPKGSIYAELGKADGAIAQADVADEHVNFRYGEGTIDDLRMALHLVAANVGVAFAPAPLLKVLSKKQVVALETVGDSAAAFTPTDIALVWKVEEDGDAIQDFVGVARGRTRNSSRRLSDAARGMKKVTRNDFSATKGKPKLNRKPSGQRKRKR